MTLIAVVIALALIAIGFVFVAGLLFGIAATVDAMTFE